MLQEQTVVSDCYILQSRIGEDACSEHWMATAIFSAKRFLLRFLKAECSDPERIEDLRKRALAGYHIRGDSVKDFVEIENFDGRLFISSEYYDERPLSEFLSNGYTMSLVHVCRAIRMLAQGLSCFHEVRVPYGFLCPENILTGIKGREFSFLKIVKPGLWFSLQNSSIAYLSPERKLGEGPSVPGDIYSIGILVVLFITGKLPFADDDPSQPGPSMRFVTNGLFRRGVPEKLVRIVLTMIMPPVSARYKSCDELLSDLHQFMSSSSTASGNSPVRESAGNSQPSSPYRPDISTEYYSELATGGKDWDKAYSRVYPLQAVDGLSDSVKIESEELRILPEEAAWTVDDYIAYGKRNVPGIEEGLAKSTVESEAIRGEVTKITSVIPEAPSSQPAPQAVAQPAQAVVSAPTAPPAQPVQSSPSVISAPVASPVPPTPSPTAPAISVESVESVTPIAKSAKTDSVQAENAPETPEPMVVPEIAEDQKSKAGRVARKRTAIPVIPDTSIVGINQLTARNGGSGEDKSWTHHRIQVKDVYGIILRSAEMAARGKGSFRYIQEPEDGYANTELYRSFERLSDKYFFVNVGSCARCGTATVEDFISMLGKGIAPALAKESRSTVGRMATKLSAGGLSDFFRGTPLWRKTQGRELMHGSSPIDAKSLEAIADAICIFARKKKPFVLVVRGGERISKELQELFTVLSRVISARPVCVVVFFERIAFEPWHVLSRLPK